MQALRWLLFCTLLPLPCLRAELAVPQGFVLQKLEPTGGKMVRPKSWFFRDNTSSGPGYRWACSKDDSTGDFDTGMQIEEFREVSKAIGATADALADAMIENLRNTADHLTVISLPEHGMYRSLRVDAEEGPYRFEYFIISSRGFDILLVQSFKAKKEDWSNHAATFKQMRGFDWLGMDLKQ